MTLKPGKFFFIYGICFPIDVFFCLWSDCVVRNYYSIFNDLDSFYEIRSE